MPDNDRHVIQADARLTQLVRERSTKIVHARELRWLLTLCGLDDDACLLANLRNYLADPLGRGSPVLHLLTGIRRATDQPNSEG